MGNEGDGEGFIDEFVYFGLYNEVIIVGVVDLEKWFLVFFNLNNEVDVVVLGEKIVLIYLNGKYVVLSGIFMVIFYVVGVLGLIKVFLNEMFGREFIESEFYV